MELIKFNNKLFGEVRGLIIEDEPYFVGKDVALALGYKNVSKALIDHIDEEDKLNNETLSSLGQRGGWLINESGLYALILGSELDTAKEFKRWVTKEVLPTIRKTGGYIPTNNEMSDEEIMAKALAIANRTIANKQKQLEQEQQKRLKAEAERNLLIHDTRTYTTSEIAQELGLSSAMKLNNLLHKMGVQYKQSKTWLLYSKYADEGYISIKQTTLDNGKIIYDRRWTGLGRDFVLNLFEGSEG